MKKIILWTINIISILIGLFFGIIYFKRLGLDYNSEGKYFDEITLVVYDKDSILTYGTLTLIFVLIGLISWILTWKLKHTN